LPSSFAIKEPEKPDPTITASQSTLLSSIMPNSRDV
jgi:hypothetical protein